jgi:flavodoxin
VKIAVVFYSKSGKSKKVAEILAKKLGADLKEIVSLQKRNGIIGFIKSGYEAAKKKYARIGIVFDNAESYDLCFIVGPVWAGNMSSPIRTFITNFANKINKVGYVFLHAGPEDKERGIGFEMDEILGVKHIAYLSLCDKNEASFESILENFAQETGKKINTSEE